MSGRQHPQLGAEPGPDEEVRVGALDAGVRVGLEDGLDGLGRGLGDERGEVVGGVGHLGVLPPGDGLDPAGRGVALVVEDREHLLAGQVAVGRGRGEPPQGDVLEGALPAGQESRRHPAGLGRPVELGEPTGPVGVGVVHREPGLLEEGRVGVVEGGEGATELGGQAGTGRQRAEIEGVARQEGVDGGAARRTPAPRSPWVRGRRRGAGGPAGRAGRPRGPSRRPRPRCAAPAPPSAGAPGPRRTRRRRTGPGCWAGPRRSPGPVRVRRHWPARRGRRGCGPRAPRYAVSAA